MCVFCCNIFRCLGNILFTKSEFVRKLFAAQDEFVKFHFNKQLQEGAEDFDELSDEEMDEILDKIHDELDFDELEREIELNEEILVNRKEYEVLKKSFVYFLNENIPDFSSNSDKKWYKMDVME